MPGLQKNMHRMDVKLANDDGYVGHLLTHFIVELSAKRFPVQLGRHFLR